MVITGRYERDDNFTTVYCEENETIYTIARNTGDWGSLKVGDVSATGHRLTKERFTEMMEGCERVGTFELEEEGCD